MDLKNVFVINQKLCLVNKIYVMIFVRLYTQIVYFAINKFNFKQPLIQVFLYVLNVVETTMLSFL